MMNLKFKYYIALLALVFSSQAFALTVADDFTQGTDTNDWTALDYACLTAGSSANNQTSNPTGSNFSSIPGCNYTASSGINALNTVGAGALRLTPSSGSQHGAIISNYTFPSNQGLQVTFTTYSYGGSNDGPAGEGADGMSFFLMNGATNVVTAPFSTTTPNLGSWGGSLGYSCSNSNTPYTGLTSGYLGLGLDEYGNFLNSGDNTATAIPIQTSSSSTNGYNSFTNGSYQQANRIGMRGAGTVSWIYLNAEYPNYYNAALSSTNQQSAVQSTCETSLVQNGTSGTVTYTLTNPTDYTISAATAATLASPAVIDASTSTTSYSASTTTSTDTLSTTLTYAAASGVTVKLTTADPNVVVGNTFTFGTTDTPKCGTTSLTGTYTIATVTSTSQFTFTTAACTATPTVDVAGTTTVKPASYPFSWASTSGGQVTMLTTTSPTALANGSFITISGVTYNGVSLAGTYQVVSTSSSPDAITFGPVTGAASDVFTSFTSAKATVTPLQESTGGTLTITLASAPATAYTTGETILIGTTTSGTNPEYAGASIIGAYQITAVPTTTTVQVALPYVAGATFINAADATVQLSPLQWSSANGGTVTIITSAASGYAVGNPITIGTSVSGSPPKYNGASLVGTYAVTAVTTSSPYTVSFTCSSISACTTAGATFTNPTNATIALNPILWSSANGGEFVITTSADLSAVTVGQSVYFGSSSGTAPPTYNGNSIVGNYAVYSVNTVDNTFVVACTGTSPAPVCNGSSSYTFANTANLQITLSVPPIWWSNANGGTMMVVVPTTAKADTLSSTLTYSSSTGVTVKISRADPNLVVGNTFTFGSTDTPKCGTTSLTGTYTIATVTSTTQFTSTNTGCTATPTVDVSGTTTVTPAAINDFIAGNTINIGTTSSGSPPSYNNINLVSGARTILASPAPTATSFAVALPLSSQPAFTNSANATVTLNVADYGVIPGGYWVLPSTNKLADESASIRTSGWPITYRLLITPGGLLSFMYSYNGGSYNPVLTNWPITQNNGPLPATFRFGFAGSTGGSWNVHEITCFEAEPTASASSAGANTVQAGQIRTGTQVYLASYNPNSWSGDLVSDPIVDTAGTVSVSTVADWDGSCVLTGGGCTAMGTTSTGTPTNTITVEATTSRQLLTWSGTAGIPLEWANLTASQQTILNSTDSNGTIRLDWLRGGRSNEQTATPAGPLRARASVLGDIIDSSPQWIGPPSNNYPSPFVDALYGSQVLPPENTTGGQTYTAFSSAQAQRLNVVYSGSNDGLLHGFRTGENNADGTYNSSLNDGLEVIGFMPSTVLANSNVVSLTSPTYAHDYFVDAPPGFGDLFYNNAWHTWQIGALGAGGAEVFALDVTDPTGAVIPGDAFSETNAANLVKVELTPASLTAMTCVNASVNCGNNMGNSYGTPLIRRLHNGQWAIIFGNGFGSPNYQAGVFIGLISSSTGAITTMYWLGMHRYGCHA